MEKKLVVNIGCGYCWVLSHQSLSVNQLISQTSTVEDEGPPLRPLTPHAKALTPILIGRTQFWDSDVDPVTGLSRGDLIRQYQALFLYALNPKAYRYRMHSLARSVWDFSDIKDFSVVSSLFQHFCTPAINGETCFSDKDVETRLRKRLEKYFKQHGKLNGISRNTDCDQDCRGRREDSPDPCDANKRRRPRSRCSSSSSGSHYRRNDEYGKDNFFRSNRFVPYWLPQCDDGFQWRRRCNYSRQPLLETIAF